MMEDAVAALKELYAQKPYQKSKAAINSGLAFNVSNLAKKYEPILRSYLL
jgi:hypothetical protein